MLVIEFLSMFKIPYRLVWIIGMERFCRRRACVSKFLIKFIII